MNDGTIGRSAVALSLAIALHAVLLSLIRMPWYPEPKPRTALAIRIAGAPDVSGRTAAEEFRPAAERPADTVSPFFPPSSEATVDEDTLGDDPSATAGREPLSPESAHAAERTIPDDAPLSSAHQAASGPSLLQGEAARAAPAAGESTPGPSIEGHADPRELDGGIPGVGASPILEVEARRSPPPSYPESARSERREGSVEIELVLDTRGRILSADIVSSSGHADLDAAAHAAVLRWRFERGEEGRRTRRRFEFRLENTYTP